MYFQAVAVLCISLFKGSSGKLGGEVTREWGDRQVRKQCYVKRKQYPDDVTGNPFIGGKSFGSVTLGDCKAACAAGAIDIRGRPCIGIEWSDRQLILPADTKRNCALLWGCEILAGNPSGSVWLLPKTLSPVPAPKTPAPVPAPKTPAPVPAPKTPAPVPAPKTPAPVPAPKTLSPVPVPKTLSPVPAPKPASQWVVGGAGASCAESCADLGMTCESVKTTTKSQLKDRLQQAGETNPKISNRSWKTNGGLNPAFLPGKRNWWVLGKKAPDCNASAFDRSGLCYCKGEDLNKLVPPLASTPLVPKCMYTIKYKKKWPNCEDIECLTAKSVDDMEELCNKHSDCTGFSFPTGQTSGFGCLKKCGEKEFGGYGINSHDYWERGCASKKVRRVSRLEEHARLM